MSLSHLQKICLPIGFSHTANQPLAYALTAHPNVVMGNNLHLLKDWWNNGASLTVDTFLLQILEMNSKMHENEMVYTKKNKYYDIAGQWQGRFDNLTVIGDCSPDTNTRTLAKNNCEALENLLDDTKLVLKLVFLVRNPYDLISSNTISAYYKKERIEILDIMIDKFIKNCKLGASLLAKIENLTKQQAFVWHLEEHIANPQQMLKKLCDFLNIDTSESYLDACAKIFYNKLSKSRHLVDWPENRKAQIATAIEQYDFLCGYNWNS